MPQTTSASPRAARVRQGVAPPGARAGEAPPATQDARSLLDAVVRAVEFLIATPDLRAALAEAGRVLGEATGVDRVNVFRYDHAEAASFLYAEWARPGVTPASAVDPGPFAEADHGEVMRPLRAGRVYHAPLAAKTGANAVLNAAAATKTDLFVPVLVDGRFWGMLNFDDCTTERAWSDGEVEVLRAAAAAVAAAVRREALERAHAEALAREREQAAEARAAELRKVNHALRGSVDALATAESDEDILAVFLRETIRVTGASAGAMLTRDGDTTQFDVVLIATDDGGVVRSPADAAHLAAEIRRVSRADRQGYFAALAAGEVRWRAVTSPLAADLPLVTAHHVAAGRRTIWDVPFTVGDRVYGYLSVAFAHDEPPSQTAVEAAQALATQAGLALQLTRLVGQAREAAVAREREAGAEARAAELATANAALRDTVAALASGRGLDAFRASVLREAARQTGAAATAVFLHDAAEDTLRLVAAYADGDEAAPDAAWLAPFRAPTPGPAAPAWRALLAGEEPLLVHAVDDEALTWPSTRAMHRGEGHRALGYLRLQVGDRPLGFVGLAWREAGAGARPRAPRRARRARPAARPGPRAGPAGGGGGRRPAAGGGAGGAHPARARGARQRGPGAGRHRDAAQGGAPRRGRPGVGHEPGARPRRAARRRDARGGAARHHRAAPGRAG
jgi:GAF domain-containing protein